ncbi:MAG: hypothetical protein K0S53_11 [Bacteroidetes bacterium]|jgi:hypothetical protein|nr:hypothetical protein [Bacteroidota bacterium]
MAGFFVFQKCAKNCFNGNVEFVEMIYFCSERNPSHGHCKN